VLRDHVSTISDRLHMYVLSVYGPTVRYYA
jgi:hypothetical protein